MIYLPWFNFANSYTSGNYTFLLDFTADRVIHFQVCPYDSVNSLSVCCTISLFLPNFLNFGPLDNSGSNFLYLFIFSKNQLIPTTFCSCFTNTFKCTVKLLIWDISNLIMYSLSAMNSTLRAALILSHHLEYVVFSLLLKTRKFNFLLDFFLNLIFI